MIHRDNRRSSFILCVQKLSFCVCVFRIASHVSHWISYHYYVCTCPVQHLHMLSRGESLISMSAHSQCSICTCSVEGNTSLVCVHMLSVGTSLISMQVNIGKHCGKDKGFLAKMKKIKNLPSSPKILHLQNKMTETDMTEDTNVNWQSLPPSSPFTFWKGSIYKTRCQRNFKIPLYYHPQTMLREANVFTPVRQSSCPQ